MSVNFTCSKDVTVSSTANVLNGNASQSYISLDNKYISRKELKTRIPGDIIRNTAAVLTLPAPGFGITSGEGGAE